MKTHLTRISKNIKTGPIPVSTSSKKNCPPSCPFRNDGCYAGGGPINIHWSLVTEGKRGVEWPDFLTSIKKLPNGQLWRHDQAGDLAGENDKLDFQALKELTAANKGRRGFTYCHYPVLPEDCILEIPFGEKEKLAAHNRKCIKYANDNGFTVNLSGNSPKHAKRLKALNIGPVVTVGKRDLTTDNDVVCCPATYKDDVNCANCGLCQKQKRKIVGFPSHGVQLKKAESVVDSWS